MTENKMTVNDAIESLTGFEEIAIAKAFNSEVLDLAQRNPFTAMRALVFIEEKRSGLNDPQAKEAAMTLTIKAVQDRFEADDEIDPEEPGTESGEDVAQPA